MDNIISDNKKILVEVQDVNKTILSKEEELAILTQEKAKLQQSKSQIEEAKKAEADKLAEEKAKKEEQDKLAKENAEKEEQDRLAKEEANRLAKAAESKKAEEQATIAKNDQGTTSAPQPKPPANTNKPSGSTSNGNNVAIDQAKDKTVYKTATGSKYHSHNSCGKSNPSTTKPISVRDAESQGLGPCAKCF